MRTWNGVIWLRTMTSLDLTGGGGIVNAQPLLVSVVEVVTLESLTGNRSLSRVFEIDETEKISTVVFGSFGDQSRTKETRKRSENVTHLALSCISRNTF